ncbi:helicase SNF2 [Mediterraneibacter gnavus]|uniref:Helicase SNF2 n=1 Tax=Mediterraneibacter gnavus TaxID=33038 RepID=A0A2N5PMR8_MEDGN|nr:helicase SNF2 [Mediterraneibacter gnavus]
MKKSLNRSQGFTLNDLKLFQHQQQALTETEGQNKVAYYLDMGLGKTFVGAEKAMNMGTDILIICQKSKIHDWIEHFFTYYIDKMKCDESGAWCYDLTKNLDMFTHSRYKVRIGVINYELAWRRPKELMNLENFTLMLDESSLIQNTSAKQSKFILQLHPENVILLSGTPVGGKYENLWSQLHLLGWNITEKMYKNQYVNWKQIDAGGIKHWIVDKDDPYKNTDRLKRKMREHGAVFMKTEEVFDLPEQIFTKIKVDKSKEYSTFMKDCIVYVDDTELVGDTTLTKMLYARQLCGVYNKEKLTAFRDLIQSTEDRLIVFYSFNSELDALKAVCKECEKPVSEVNGHIKDLTAYEYESNSVTLVQYQAGSKGLNLQKCNRIIYFTLPLSSEDFEQSKKRIHRIGQEQTCFYYLMLCRGSIEERILKTLEERKDFTDELFEEC